MIRLQNPKLQQETSTALDLLWALATKLQHGGDLFGVNRLKR
jgi:hypothetical protein